MSDTYDRLCIGRFSPDDDDTAIALVCWYHVECERYDRVACVDGYGRYRVGPGGGAVTLNLEQRWTVEMHAGTTHDVMMAAASMLGCTSCDIRRARGHLDRDGSFEEAERFVATMPNHVSLALMEAKWMTT